MLLVRREGGPYIPGMSFEDLLRQIIREELARVDLGRASDRLAYSVAELAQAVGVSDRQMYKHLDRRDITPVFSGTKAIIPVAEAERFLRDLPDENRGPL